MELLCAASWLLLPGTLLPPGGDEYILQEENSKRKILPGTAPTFFKNWDPPPNLLPPQAEKNLDKGKEQSRA